MPDKAMGLLGAVGRENKCTARRSQPQRTIEGGPKGRRRAYEKKKKTWYLPNLFCRGFFRLSKQRFFLLKI